MTKLYRISSLTFLALITFTISAFAQTSIADSLKREGLLDLAIKEYTNTFKTDPQNQQNTYKLASAFALTYYQNDKAFYYLNIALQSDSSLWALADPDLIGMAEDERWKDIISQQMTKYQLKNGKLSHPKYAEKLLDVIRRDQVLDYQIKLARKYYMENGLFPHWYYPIEKMKREIAENNFQLMEDMISEYGWPKYSMVGDLAADAPLLVINHHESKEVRKKYLTAIEVNCLIGQGSCMEYAKIQDRILVDEGKLQIYGMQFRYTYDRTLEPFPIVDPEYVDQRRLSIGLEPIKDYLKRKIDYDWKIIQKQK
jgi:hypothetical protein